MVDVDCCIDCFSPRDKWRLGVNHHGSCFLSDGPHGAFGKTILMVTVGTKLFVCCAMSSEHQSECVVVLFPAARIAPKLFHFVSQGVISGLK